MRSFQVSIRLLLLWAALFLPFSNCSRSSFSLTPEEGQLQSSSLDLDACKPVYQKLNDAGPTKLASDLIDVTFSEDESLTVILDNACMMKSGPQSWITESLTADKTLAPGLTTTGALALPESLTGAEVSREAEQDPCILRVDKNPKFQFFSLPNDPKYTASQQPYLFSINHDKVAPYIFNSFNGINQPIRVAVLDSGFDTNHPDLNSLFVRDINGQVIALNAIDNNTDVLDTGFHGTHVVGLIAATANNGIGISGVLGAQVRILPVKVSTDGTSVNMSAVIAGIRWAADNGAKVINMSLGGPTDRPALREALQYAIEKGVFIAVASGNDGKTLGSSFKIYPAMYASELRGMIAVGSFDASSLGVSSFSNTSSVHVDLLAPGSNGSSGILSTVPSHLSGSGYGSHLSKNGSAYPIQGTSMATPLAAGVAAGMIALANSRGYDALPDQIESLIEIGSPSSTSFATAAKSGRRLDFRALIQVVDQQTGLAIDTNQDRHAARGTVAITTQPQNVNAQAGQNIALSIALSSTSSPLVNYRWYRNNTLISQSRTPQLNLNNLSASHAGVYRVEVIAGSNKATSSDATVVVSGAASTNPNTNNNCF